MASAPSKTEEYSVSPLHVKIEAVTPSLELGEGPHWNDQNGILYFVNVYASEVHCYDPVKEEHKFIKVGEKPVTFVLPLADKKDEFLISTGRELQILKWDGKSQKFSVNHYITLEKKEDSRMNDAKASPSNVLFAGSMGNEKGSNVEDKQGSLYVVKDNNVKTLLDSVGISNGLAWNADQTQFYWNDTKALKTYKFKYDHQTKTISDQKVLVDFKEKNLVGAPDGLTIDSEGHLWIACFAGSKIIRVNSETGDVLLSIGVPCTNVTSVVFGGPNFEVIYCTTATHTVDKKDLTIQAGCVLKITGLPYRGVPSRPVKL